LRVFLALLAISAGISACVLLRGYRQLAVIHEINTLGGEVVLTPADSPRLRAAMGNERMRMFDRVEEVRLDRSTVTDATLRKIGGLTDLKVLRLRDTQVTNEGLAHLHALTKLERLDVASTDVTDGGLAHVKKLTSLRKLNLDNTTVTDAGLAHV